MHGDVRIKCLFNLAGEPLAVGADGSVLLSLNGATVENLPGFGALYLQT